MRLIAPLLLLATAAFAAPRSLSDGKTFDGWEGDTAGTWRIVDGAGDSYTIVAMGVKFDLSSLTVAAGKAFSIVFDNQDTHEGATPM